MNINSNVIIFPMTPGQRMILSERTGWLDMKIDGEWKLVDLDSILDHGEFCGAAEYFVDPKGVA